MTIRVALILAIGSLGLMAWSAVHGSEPSAGSGARTPVLVELFTSEGCSSCPPADRLLEKLDQQPVPGAEIIVLSEHVDYWNHIGWKDPYSDHFYSERQNVYAERFGLDSVYTPQMVVDGSSEFTGSDSGLADKALAKALATPKISVRASGISVDPSRILHAHVETAALGGSFGRSEAEVYVAIALNRAESEVSGGENSGHKLTHVSVVRNLTKVGTLRQGQTYKQDVQLNLEAPADLGNLRIIVFVQEPRQGKVLGASMTQVAAK